MDNEIVIFGDIGSFENSASGIKRQLDDFDGGDVTINISSGGGDVGEGLGIYNAIKNYKGHVTAHITGIALSMASGIAMAADTVIAAENALIMIHEPQTFAAGDEAEMTRKGKMLAATREALLVAYVNKSGLSTARVEAMMREETWLTANEAKELGFVDVVGEPIEAFAKCEIPDSIKVPAALVENVSKLLTVPKVEETTTVAEPKNETKEVGPIPATLDELLSLAGADNDFAIEQLKTKSTLSQAQNALNAVLVEKLTAAESRAQDAAKKADEVAKQAGSADTGHDPVPSARDNAGSSDGWSDPLSTFEEKFAENRKRYKDSVLAYRMTDKKNPGLINAVRAAAN